MRGFIVRQTVLAAKYNRGALVQRKQIKRVHKIVSQTGIDSLRVLFCLPLLLIHTHQLLATPRVFAKAIVRDSIKPCGKPRFTAKAADVFVGPEKSFLREVICKSDVCAGELPQQTAHARLMPSHEFTEGVLIVIGKNSRNEVRISELHGCNITVPGAEAECPFCFPISIQSNNQARSGTESVRTTMRRLPSR
jgi:hypothetical protein